MATAITIQAHIHAPVKKVWKYYTEPGHVTQWNYASDDWHSPHARSDLRVDGTFTYRMEARDGSTGFDFTGKYTDVKKHEVIAYMMDDGRKVRVTFSTQGQKTNVKVTFDPENENPIEMQRQGWQAILDNFKKYIESAT